MNCGNSWGPARLRLNYPHGPIFLVGPPPVGVRRYFAKGGGGLVVGGGETAGTYTTGCKIGNTHVWPHLSGDNRF